jgi:homoserine O-succinyltransferase/O-acetyltransferase
MMAVTTESLTLEVPRRTGKRTGPNGEGRPLRIGFVNNMPDAAFEDTYRQFHTLIRADSDPSTAELRCYYIPSVPRGADVLSGSSVPYCDLEFLYRDPPDALMITGTEPKQRDLRAEPYWDELSELLRWAVDAVPSTLLSCLASHAAVLALDGIPRSPLPKKQSGVFRQSVDEAHPLASGLGATVAFPHSRLNEIPTRPLKACGYRVVVAAPRTGWTVATRETAGRLLVLLQGHPEYSTLTLLREYRRDVRRFLAGSRPTHPDIPVNYLDESGQHLLAAFRARCESRSGAEGVEFPFEAAARHIADQWDGASRQLFANWMVDARLRTALATT